MKLAPNAVYALVCEFGGEVSAFLHINKDGCINPFWFERNGRVSVHGELRGHPAGGHEHWRNIGPATKIVMVQSHVAKASEVNFKRCRKFARNVKRK